VAFPLLSQLITPVQRSSVLRRWAAALLLWPAVAFGNETLASRLHDVGEIVQFVPDRALGRLQAMAGDIATAPPPVRTDYLYFYSSAERGTGNLKHALALADELVRYGKQQHDNVALAKGLLGRANTQYLLEQLSEAHATSFQAEQVARTTSDMATRVQTTIAAGQSFQEQGNYPAALSTLQSAADLARQIGNDAAPLASALHALVLLYVNLNQIEKGWEAQRESLAMARTMASPGRIAVALRDDYALAIEQNAFQRARDALFEGLGLENSIGARQMAATTLVNLSDCYLKEHNFHLAQAYATQALQAAIAVNSNNDIATARVNLGQAFLGLGRLAEGKRQFEAGLATYEKQGDKPELQSVLLEYGGALEHAGDYKGAIDAYHRERRISREMFAEERRKAVLELQQKHDTEKKQRQIEALRQENRVAHAELDNRRLHQRIWWLLAVVFALAAAIAGLLYRNVRQANAKLKEKNLELKQQSSLDPLTLLYNRRHFQEFMRTEDRAGHARHTTGGDTVGALFLLDVDHFKNVNDTFGHAAGDAVLKMIAHNLRVALRETDMIVRWGGEEFLAFLPAVPRHGLDEVARRILYCISSQALEYQGTAIAVNVSVGFAPFPLAPGDTALTWERTLNLVDMALYLAKSHGRNRAHGVLGFANVGQVTMDAIEQDLEKAWRAGFVEMSVVLGGSPGEPQQADAGQPGASVPGNIVPLKRESKAGR
jgi:diguanylate cyclase (GGDEF)-like protein